MLGGVKGDGNTVSIAADGTISTRMTYAYVLIGKNGAMISYDLQNWTSVLDSPFGLKTIAYGDGMMLSAGLGTKFFLSILGNKWTDFDTGVTQNINAVIKSPYGWAAVCDGGLLLVSQDGFSWSQSAFAFPVSMTDIVWNEVFKKFFAVGKGGQIWSSPDLQTWTSVTSGATDLNSIAVNNVDGTTVAVGENGVTIYSKDGNSWSAGSFPYGITCNKITYKNNLFLAAGNNNTLYSGSDGITWSPVATTIQGTDFLLFTYEDGLYVIGTRDGRYAFGPNFSGFNISYLPIGEIYGISKCPIFPETGGIINMLNAVQREIKALKNIPEK